MEGAILSGLCIIGLIRSEYFFLLDKRYEYRNCSGILIYQVMVFYLQTMKHEEKKVKREEKSAEGKSLSHLECVLGDDFMNEELPVVDVYVGLVPDKKFIRSVILGLNSVLPISELQHLKRVYNNKVIVCFVSEKSETDVFSLLSKLCFDLKLISDKLEVVSVTKCAPKTRRQFLFSNKLWPTNFHEDKYLENLISGLIFSEADVKNHEKWMRMALEAAKRSEKRSGTVVIDPQRNEVVAVASDSRNDHPIKHSIMVAVDLVARTQGGGTWEPHPADYYYSEIISRDYQNPEDQPYLCTGYYVYTTREPCTMCAMGLVHSRAKRVFYGIPSPDGALGTCLKLHTVKNLNHHFEVFRGLLKNEIALL